MVLEIPFSLQGPVTPHTIVTLPNTNGMQLLLCYDNEGVYVNTYGKVTESEKLNYPKLDWSCRCRRTSFCSGESCRPAWPTLALARSWAGATRPSRSGLDSSLKAETVIMVSSPRSVETGHLDGVFMHKKAQKLKFLCERNDKVGFGPEIEFRLWKNFFQVFFSSAKGGSSCQIYFMTLNKPGMANW